MNPKGSHAAFCRKTLNQTCLLFSLGVGWSHKVTHHSSLQLHRTSPGAPGASQHCCSVTAWYTEGERKPILLKRTRDTGINCDVLRVPLRGTTLRHRRQSRASSGAHLALRFFIRSQGFEYRVQIQAARIKLSLLPCVDLSQPRMIRQESHTEKKDKSTWKLCGPGRRIMRKTLCDNTGKTTVPVWSGWVKTYVLN